MQPDPLQDLGTPLREFLWRAGRAWRGIVGAPDYQAYLAHRQAHHPSEPVMSEREYVRCFIDRRYNKPGGGVRCC